MTACGNVMTARGNVVTADRLPAALRAVVLLVASLVLLGTSGIELAGRATSTPGAGSHAGGLLPPALDDTQGTLAVLRAALAATGGQPAGAAGLPPVAGPVVAPPHLPAPDNLFGDQPVVGVVAGPRHSRAPPLTTGT